MQKDNANASDDLTEVNDNNVEENEITETHRSKNRTTRSTRSKDSSCRKTEIKLQRKIRIRADRKRNAPTAGRKEDAGRENEQRRHEL